MTKTDDMTMAAAALLFIVAPLIAIACVAASVAVGFFYGAGWGLVLFAGLVILAVIIISVIMFTAVAKSSKAQ